METQFANAQVADHLASLMKTINEMKKQLDQVKAEISEIRTTGSSFARGYANT